MDSPKVITIVAGVCSSIAIIGCILMMPLLNQEASNLERDVQAQIRLFKVTTDGLWSDLILMVSRMPPTHRQQRQVGPGTKCFKPRESPSFSGKEPVVIRSQKIPKNQRIL